LLTAFLIRCICALPPLQKRHLRDFMLANPHILVGTMCSGTDVPILAVISLQLALDMVFGLQWSFEHSFSFELSKPKRNFINKFVPDVDHLFGDCTNLRRTAWCHHC